MRRFLALISCRLPLWMIIGFFFSIAIAVSWWTARGLSYYPWIKADAESYLGFSEIRPHGYPIFLSLYKQASPDLRHLPAVQDTMLWIAVATLSVAVTIRSSAIWPGLLTFFLASSLRSLDQSGVMSNSLYTTLITLAVAAYLFFTATHRIIWLGFAALCFGAAAITRTVGVVPAAIFLGCLLVQGWWRRWTNFKVEAAIAILPIIVCLVVAAASNLRHNGEFRVGSWSGVSMLGKSLIIARPLPAEEPGAVLNWIPEKTSQARKSLERLDDLALRMLVQRQYYEYLRWFFIWKELDRRGVPFLTERGRDQNRIAQSLGFTYIQRQPVQYLRLALYDYLALFSVPGVITRREAREVDVEI